MHPRDLRSVRGNRLEGLLDHILNERPINSLPGLIQAGEEWSTSVLARAVYKLCTSPSLQNQREDEEDMLHWEQTDRAVA